MARLVRIDDRAVRRIAGRAVGRHTGAVWRRARQTAPRRTGELAASIRHEVDDSGPAVRGRVWSDLPYAGFVHNGRGPVRARPGSALGPLPAPFPRFVRSVGPAAPQPWLLEALRDAQPWPVREGR